MKKDKGKIVKDYTEGLWSARDLSAIDEHFIPNAIFESSLGKTLGTKSLRAFTLLWFQAFPKGKVIVDKVMCCDNVVASHWYFTAIHQGEFGCVTPSGKTISLEGINCFGFQDDKIVSYYSKTDLSALMDFNQPLLTTNDMPAKKNTLHAEIDPVFEELKNINGAQLSYREIECLSLWVMGLSSKKAATLLGISAYTFETHKSNLKAKLKVNSKSELMECIHASGLLYLLLYIGRGYLRSLS